MSILKNMIILGRLQLSLTLTLQVLLIVEDVQTTHRHSIADVFPHKKVWDVCKNLGARRRIFHRNPTWTPPEALFYKVGVSSASRIMLFQNQWKGVQKQGPFDRCIFELPFTAFFFPHKKVLEK